MSQKPFKFKQFIIEQDKCAMKIGTDAVLLGAWSSVNTNPFSVLDIGSGTGVIALMHAQKSSAEIIDAIEIDENAYEQCVSNFENSNWNDRLFCYHASLEEFVEEIDDKYDLIVSNPPFYKEDYKSENQQRDVARFEDALPFKHLIKSASKLLSKEGVFHVIIPYKESENFIELSKIEKLLPSKILNIKGSSESEIKRTIIEFSFKEKDVVSNELIIETSRHNYTKDYVSLTKDFYLKM